MPTFADFPALVALAPGDLAQIHPLADPTFGGAFMLIEEAYSPHQVRGPLLIPHRGGCREAWQRRKPVELLRIGPALYPDPPFCRRVPCSCPYEAASHDPRPRDSRLVHVRPLPPARAR